MMREKERCRFKVDTRELSEWVYERQTVAVEGGQVVVVDVTPFFGELREGVIWLNGQRAVVVQAYPSSRPLLFQWFVRCWLE